MTVFENIMGIAQISIQNIENQKAVTEKLLDEFNLQHLRTINASVLSGGEIRRLMMARIMINKPKILPLDEPLAALDPLIQDIQKYILKIQSSGTAILVTDHNVKNLFDITDRSYVLGEQTVIAEGTSRELLKSQKLQSNISLNFHQINDVETIWFIFKWKSKTFNKSIEVDWTNQFQLEVF